MALYLVATLKATQELGGRKWSNRYFIEAATMAEALDGAKGIWQSAERLFHYTDVYCYAVYANLTTDPPFTPGQQSPVDASVAFGQRTLAGQGQLMPTFNVARVDFAVAGSRPSRKFYRPMLREGDVNGDSLEGGMVTAITNGIAALPGDFLRDVDNQPWTIGGGVVRGVSSRRLGRDSFVNVPPPPVVGP